MNLLDRSYFSVIRCDIVADTKIDGAIATNTTISRAGLQTYQENRRNRQWRLYQQQTDLLAEIAQLESQISLTYVDIYRLRKLKRCLTRIDSNISDRFIKDKDWTSLRQVSANTNDPLVRIATVSALLDNNFYTRAQNYMDDVPDTSDDWLQYVECQEILIRLLENYERFELSSTEEQNLLEYGMTRNLYSPFIRGVYAETTGESILLDNKFIIAAQRNNDIHNAERVTQVTVYPNPSQTEVTFAAAKNIVKISIFSLSGRLITNVEVNEQKRTSLNVSTFTRGVFIANLQLQDGSTENIRFVKL